MLKIYDIVSVQGGVYIIDRDLSVTALLFQVFRIHQMADQYTCYLLFQQMIDRHLKIRIDGQIYIITGNGHGKVFAFYNASQFIYKDCLRSFPALEL